MGKRITGTGAGEHPLLGPHPKPREKGKSVKSCTSIHAEFGYSADKIELPDLEIPVKTAPQRQGDVFLLPVTTTHPGEPIPTAGVTVVRAESSAANMHNLHGDGAWLWSPDADTNLVQGWLTVPAGGVAYLIHTEEHPALAVGPVSYEVRRQQEWAGGWRRVAD